MTKEELMYRGSSAKDGFNQADVYPYDLCKRMLSYACFAKKTENMRASEIKSALEIFFDRSAIDKAADELCGRSEGEERP